MKKKLNINYSSMIILIASAIFTIFVIAFFGYSATSKGTYSATSDTDENNGLGCHAYDNNESSCKSHDCCYEGGQCVGKSIDANGNAVCPSDSTGGDDESGSCSGLGVAQCWLSSKCCYEDGACVAKIPDANGDNVCPSELQEEPDSCSKYGSSLCGSILGGRLNCCWNGSECVSGSHPDGDNQCSNTPVSCSGLPFATCKLKDGCCWNGEECTSGQIDAAGNCTGSERTVTITFDPGLGRFDSSMTSGSEIKKCTISTGTGYCSIYPLSGSAVVRGNMNYDYSFIGWSKSSSSCSASDIIYSVGRSDELRVSNDATYYACFQKNNIVNFLSSGGVFTGVNDGETTIFVYCTPSNGSSTCDINMNSVSDPERDGFTFIGYSKERSCPSIDITPTQSSYSTPSYSTTNPWETYYACWRGLTPKTATVKFYKDGNVTTVTCSTTETMCSIEKSKIPACDEWCISNCMIRISGTDDRLLGPYYVEGTSTYTCNDSGGGGGGTEEPPSGEEPPSEEPPSEEPPSEEPPSEEPPSEEPPVNPGTGTFGVMAVWFIGLLALIYSFYYFKTGVYNKK